jgi:hypothetical protein
MGTLGTTRKMLRYLPVFVTVTLQLALSIGCSKQQFVLANTTPSESTLPDLPPGSRATSNLFRICDPAAWLGTLGGWGLAVSRFSPHPREALELVRYLSHRDLQVKRSRVLSAPPSLPELYNLPEVREPNPRFYLLSQAFRTGIVLRPSNVSGKKYQDVSEAYFQAVHSVLAGAKSASQVAAALENELTRTTGFKKGPPPPMGPARP